MKVLQKALRHAFLPQELTKTKKHHYKNLRHKLSERHKVSQERLWKKHTEALDWVGKNFSPHHITAGSLGSLMLLSPISVDTLPTLQTELPRVEGSEKIEDISQRTFLINDLATYVPFSVRPLLPDEEDSLTKLLSERFKMRIVAELDGKRLNRSYGYIGAEQHLARYPGDSMATHFATADEANRYYSSGMAPGLGAWGYFTESRSALTETDIAREKYYIAVQTFLSPGYNEHVHEFYEFYKFRKMMVINPDNGKAMIVVIGDAGPAQWTGKSLGGSPEVMKYLERQDGKARGGVLYFFVDDPEDKIPLGPIELPEVN